MDGLILFAHGARNPDWARPFEAIAARLRAAHPERPLALAYLELMQPDLATAAQALLTQGCTRVHILPMFLGASGHVRRDLPPRVQELAERHPQVQWLLHDAIGEQARVSDAMAAAVQDLISAAPAAGSPSR